MGKRYRARIARAQTDKKLRQSVGNFADGVTGHLKEIANMVGITQAVLDAVVEALGPEFEPKVRRILDRKSEEAKARAEEESKETGPDVKAIRQLAETVATSNAHPDMAEAMKAESEEV